MPLLSESARHGGMQEREDSLEEMRQVLLPEVGRSMVYGSTSLLASVRPHPRCAPLIPTLIAPSLFPQSAALPGTSPTSSTSTCAIDARTAEACATASPA